MNIPNAGDFKYKINIVRGAYVKQANGAKTWQKSATVISPYAKIKTTKGFTLIKNDSDFEKALTNFTIRYPVTAIDRDMRIEFRDKLYEIQYLNNIDEANVLLEIQAKEITH